MFGNQPNQGGGLFGGAGIGNLQSTQSAGLFGGNNNMPNNQNQGSLFGATQSKPPSFGGGGGGGLFNNPAQTNSGTGLFGGATQPQGGGGLFGGNQIAPQNQGNQGGGLFGQTQPSGLFGNQNQMQQQQPQQQGGGLFGKPATQGLFGGQTTQPATGLFGQTNPSQIQQPANQGLFGNTQTNQSFGQQPSTGGLFGGGQQNKPGGLFGNQQTPVGGGLLPTTTTQNSLFQQPATTSAWGTPQQQPTTFQTQGFGQNQNTPGFGTNTNQLGGTSWGVNTSFNQPLVTQQQPISNQPSITAVKSKNPKVDSKHSVKCISALDQYNGMSKQQIRCYYLLNGGAMPAPQVTNTGFAQNTGGTLWNKPTTTPSTTSFTTIGAPQTNLGTSTMFGAKPTGTGLFGATTQPVTSTFGTQPAQTSSLFGGQNTTQTQGSLFSNQTPQQGPLFNTVQQPQQQQGGGLFGQQTSLFGGQQQTQPQTGFGQQTPQTGGSLFGQTTPAQTGSLFGQTTQQTGSLFNTSGQGQPAQTSLFGQTNPVQQGGNSLFGNTQTTNQPGATTTTGGLFGSSTGGGLFNQTTPANTGGSLFAQPTQNTGSLFNQPQQQTSLFNQPQGQQQGFQQGFQQQPFQQQNPYGSNLSMLTSFPLQSNILSNEAILDPNYNQNSNNMLSVVLNALVSGGAISKNDADKLLRPTPFDQLVKKRQKQLQKQKQQQQIFTNVPSIFQDPLNFKRFDIPDDFFQMRRSNAYWQKQKQRQQNDRRKFNIAYAPSKKQQKPILTPLRQYGDDVQRAVKRSRKVQKHQLPSFNDLQYKLKPSLMRISMMTVDNIKNVQNVQIIGKYGKIRFLQPVSLYMKDIQDCIDIQQDTIDIKDPEWQSKKCQLTFANFGGYKNKDQNDQKKISSKMLKWVKKNQQDNMKLIQFDQQDGTLIVTIH